LPVTDNLGSQEYKIKKEIAVMKLCRHPHVVRLLEVIDDKLYQKVYMGQSLPPLLQSLSPPFCPFVCLWRLCAQSCRILRFRSLMLITVMEFLGGGEIKWRDSESSPVLRVDQSRRICRDVILGLEYRSWFPPSPSGPVSPLEH
jgi:serine/threonine protein kinase